MKNGVLKLPFEKTLFKKETFITIYFKQSNPTPTRPLLVT